MVLYIAICDDEKRISAELEDILLNILDKQPVEYEIDVFNSGEALCAKLEEGAHYDLIYLDIEFAASALNGVEVGRLIRETYQNDLTSIVYISWEMKYSMQLFALRPLHFLLKPLDYAKVEQTVTTHLRIAGLWAAEFIYKTGFTSHKVPVKNILYLQSDRRKIILHLAGGKQQAFYGKLKEVYQNQLQQFAFLLIHSSFVVNYDYIAQAKYDEMLLIDGTCLPISQPRRKEVKEAYYNLMEQRGN